jgi:hypothetical protein
MKIPVLSLIAGLALLASCSTTTPTPTPDPDPFVPPSKPNAAYALSYGFETPTFTKTMTVGQANTLTFKATCLLQDNTNDQDLIRPINPQIGTAKLFYTAKDGTNRKELGSSAFTNGKAAVAFTPSEAGSFLMKSEVVVDGVTYSSADFAAMTNALQSKCKQLIGGDPQFAAISGQYNIATTFASAQVSSFSGSVTFQ